MNPIEKQIKEIVDRETRAWDTQDIELLLTIFHPDMVWPWPKDSMSHNPVDWVMELGRFNEERWKKGWQDLFDTHTLIHNNREIIKISISDEGDGAFAVVDVDTLWRRNSDGEEFHWKGRACKVYTKVFNEWKLIMHTGLLEY
ncbi:MAG: DUF4440 domain-containing protein [Planctomycetia bacterium]|nr:DUF4440 domain-containing protein [Planctomycetia bacterium]